MIEKIVVATLMSTLFFAAGCIAGRKALEEKKAQDNLETDSISAEVVVNNGAVEMVDGGNRRADSLLSAGTSQREAAKILISKESLTLSVLDSGGSVITQYPIAAGSSYGNKRTKGDRKTPEGTFEVQQIQNASAWTHDFGDGKGEIKGAYGSHFVRLLTPPHSGMGIHGTHDPASIGTRASEGCIRLRNEDLLEFVELIRVGLPVSITASEKDRAADM